MRSILFSFVELLFPTHFKNRNQIKNHYTFGMYVFAGLNIKSVVPYSKVLFASTHLLTF